MPEPIYVPTAEAICKKAPCSGDMAQVTAWYDAKGKIRLYVHAGDIQRCSHPQAVYFDRDTNEVGTIALLPVQPGSDDEKRFGEARTRWTKALTKGGSRFCGKPRVDP